MKSKPLYLVASRRGSTPRNRLRRSHLRLVCPSAAAERPLPSRRAPVPPVVPPVVPRGPAPSLSRPLGQRLLQAASDAAVLCVALLSGVLPNA